MGLMLVILKFLKKTFTPKNFKEEQTSFGVLSKEEIGLLITGNIEETGHLIFLGI
jgi:hypothetical protein